MSAEQPPRPPGRFTISKAFEVNGVSHELRFLPEGHKCRRNHGHNYVVTLTLTADRLDEYGFVTDFGELAPFGDYLKENIEPQIHGRLVSVRVAETRLSSALWERPDAL